MSTSFIWRERNMGGGLLSWEGSRKTEHAQLPGRPTRPGPAVKGGGSGVEEVAQTPSGNNKLGTGRVVHLPMGLPPHGDPAEDFTCSGQVNCPCARVPAAPCTA